MSNACTYCVIDSQRKHISFHPDPYEKIEKRAKWKLNFPTGPIMHHIHIFLFFRVRIGTLLVSRPHPSALRLLVPQHSIAANFHKNGKTAAFCISSPLCDSDWTLRFAGSVVTVRQLHPAGCVVGVPSVVWELCLQDTALPGEKGRGRYLTHCSSVTWQPSPYHIHLTSFKFCWNQKITELLPAWIANRSFCVFCVCVATPYHACFPSTGLYVCLNKSRD